MGERQHLLPAAYPEWNSWGCPVQGQELVSVVLVAPFHLCVFFAFRTGGQAFIWFLPQVPGNIFREYPLLASTLLSLLQEQHPFLRGIPCSRGWSCWGKQAQEQDETLGFPAEPRMRISASHRDLPWEESASPAGLDLLDTSKPTQQPWHKSLGKREALNQATMTFFYIARGTGCYGLSA